MSGIHKGIEACLTIIGLFTLTFVPMCADGRVTYDIVEDCIAEAESEDEMLKCLERQTETRDYAEQPEEIIPRVPVSDRIKVITRAPKKFFVGDEPVPIRYEIYVPLHVRIKELDYNVAINPFELVSVNMESRAPVPRTRDMEVQEIILVVILPVRHAYGNYKLPALKIPYEYESMNGDVRAGAILTGDVTLMKVALFVDVLQEHDIGVIGDIFELRVEIHADKNAEVLNEYAPEKGKKNVAYLSDYEVRDPFKLLDSSRDEFRSEHYRIIQWRYDVAVHGAGGESYELPVPQVVWRKDDESRAAGIEVSPHTVSPNPVHFMLRSITGKDSTLKPMKGVKNDPLGERSWLLILPRLTIWVLYGAGILLGFVHVMQVLRTRKLKAKGLPEMEVPEKPRRDYERWPHQKFLLNRKKIGAWETYRREPSNENCKRLRDILARQAAMRLGKRGRITIQEACAMTASELESLVGETPEIAYIRELDRQLETGESATFGNVED